MEQEKTGSEVSEVVFTDGEQDLSHEEDHKLSVVSESKAPVSERTAAGVLKTISSVIAWYRQKDLWLMDEETANELAPEVLAMAEKYHWFDVLLREIEERGPEYKLGYWLFGRALADLNDEKRKRREANE